MIIILLLFCVLGFWPTTSKRYTNYLYSKSFSPAWPLCSSEICRQQNHIIQGKGKYLIHEKLHSKCACLYYVQWCIYNFQNETSTFFFFLRKNLCYLLLSMLFISYSHPIPCSSALKYRVMKHFSQTFWRKVGFKLALPMSECDFKGRVKLVVGIYKSAEL